MSVYNIHAGHNPDGKIACGAIGLIKESTEARKVKDIVIQKLRSLGNTVYDCTVDNGITQSNVLSKIVNKCNAHKADLDISIHFNAGANNKNGNGKTTGTEVLVYSSSSKSLKTAKVICDSIAYLGFKNRGIKYSTGLYFLRKTKSPALLIECCFVDDKDDVMLYRADKMANAIVKGITGIKESIPNIPNEDSTKNIDYSLVFDAIYYANKYADLKNAFGTNASALLNHFINNGMKEGRQAISSFNVQVYKNNYPDLQMAFGNDLPVYYLHYINSGYKEMRVSI